MSEFERDIVISRELRNGIQLHQPNFIQDTIVQSLSPKFNLNDGLEDNVSEKYDIQRGDIQEAVRSDTKTIDNKQLRITDVNYSELKNGVSPRNTRTVAFEEIYAIKLGDGSRVCVRSEEGVFVDMSDHSILEGYLRVYVDDPSQLNKYDSITLVYKEDNGLVLKVNDRKKDPQGRGLVGSLDFPDSCIDLQRLGLVASVPLISPIAWYFGLLESFIVLGVMFYTLLLIEHLEREEETSTEFNSEWSRDSTTPEIRDQEISAEFVEEESLVLRDVDVRSRKTVQFDIEETSKGIELTSDEVDHKWTIRKEDGVYSSEVINLFESVGFNTIEENTIELTIVRSPKDESEGLKSEDNKWVIPTNQSGHAKLERNSVRESLELA